MTEEEKVERAADRAAIGDAVTTWIMSIAATGAACYFGAPLWAAPLLLYGMVTLGYTNMRVFQLSFQVRLIALALTESDRRVA